MQNDFKEIGREIGDLNITCCHVSPLLSFVFSYLLL
jgi:hypothetical protein